MLRIHSFESMGTFDGPGLRLVVFLQGCNFKCLYCANPDTIPINQGGKVIDGTEIIRRAISEKPFFGKRGGVTFSGGEPTVQAKELIPICRELKENGIHICIDTNGSIHNHYVDELLDIVDMVLLDCKQFNPERHKALVAHDNIKTLKTAEKLYKMSKPVRLRYVLVPGYSDFREDMLALGEHFGRYDNIERIEVLPYHTYGKHKYENLGQKYFLEEVREPSVEEVDQVVELFKPFFKQVWRQ